MSDPRQRYSQRIGATLLCACCVAARAADETPVVSGEVGMGASSVYEHGIDRAKLFEYRDVSGGWASMIDVHARSPKQYLNLYAEHLGREDQRMTLDAGQYQRFRFKAYSDRLPHNVAWGARTPYNGVGSAQLTANLPSLASAGWTPYDLSVTRRKDGGAATLRLNPAWSVRMDVDDLRDQGLKLQSYGQGTSPIHGFVDLPVPVHTRTQTLGMALAYATHRLSAEIGYGSSRFDNTHSELAWQNGFLNGMDHSLLAPDNDTTRWHAQLVLKQLPLHGQLALRTSMARSESSVAIRPSMLLTPPSAGAAGSEPSSQASQPVFDGQVDQNTYAASLTLQPSRGVSTRLYANRDRKHNQSSPIVFLNLPAGFGCGQAPLTAGPPALSSCETELFESARHQTGIDVGMRIHAVNRFNLGYENARHHYVRRDSRRALTQTTQAGWRNTALDTVTLYAKAKYQRRRASFEGAGLGVDPTDPLYLQRAVMRYDVADRRQTLWQLGADGNPMPQLGWGVQYSHRRTRYPDTLLGRTHDERQSLDLNVSWGQAAAFRLNAFLGWEVARYASDHRAINAGSCPVIPPAVTPSDCFDPLQPPTTVVYNWHKVLRDHTHSAGLGFDWPLRERLVLQGSLVWLRTESTVAADAQTLAGGTPAANLVDIGNYGNHEKLGLHLKGNYRLNPQWRLTAGLGYEKLRLNDVQFNGYTDTVPVAGSGATTSYLSGAYAWQSHTATLAYGMVVYTF